MKIVAFFEEEGEVSRSSASLLEKLGIESRFAVQGICSGPITTEGPFVAHVLSLLEQCMEESVDLALLFSRFAGIYDGERLRHFLNTETVFEHLATFSVTDITGLGFRGSPRLPYVDDHFMVLNVTAMRDVGFLERPQLRACHFRTNAGVQAELISWLETAFQAGEFFNCYEKGGVLDRYGRTHHYFPLPFSLNTITGVAVCDVDYDPELLSLLEKNMDHDAPGPARRTRMVSGHYVFAKGRILSAVFKFGARFYASLVNRDFQRKFDEK